jgi:hypothetical protein
LPSTVNPMSITNANCLAATTVSTPCTGYEGTFTAQGASGTSGTITLYTSNAPANAQMLVCPYITISTAGSAGSVNQLFTWTTPGGSTNTNSNVSGTSLTSTGYSATCRTFALKGGSSFSFSVTAAGGTGSPVWETEITATRLY